MRKFLILLSACFLFLFFTRSSSTTLAATPTPIPTWAPGCYCDIYRGCSPNCGSRYGTNCSDDNWCLAGITSTPTPTPTPTQKHGECICQENDTCSSDCGGNANKSCDASNVAVGDAYCQGTLTPTPPSCSCSGRTCSAGCQNAGTECYQDPSVCQEESSVNNIMDNIQQAPQCGTVGQACCRPISLPDSPAKRLTDMGIWNGPMDLIFAWLNALWNPIKSFFNEWIHPIFRNFIGDQLCTVGSPDDLDHPEKCQCISNRTFNIGKLCNEITNAGENSECIKCTASIEDDGKAGIWTAIGCVSGDFNKFLTETLLGWGVGLAGIIALLCIIYAAFTLQTSRGNPERVKKAQELLTSCIMGLMLIIFSVFILRLIGVDILKIPGFGK